MEPIKQKTIKQKTIKQTGIEISGITYLYTWLGEYGWINMEPYYLPNEKITPKNILRCVNDNGFGCESIESAEIDIEIVYDNGCKEFDRTIIADQYHSNHFLGWKELREQGIEC